MMSLSTLVEGTMGQLGILVVVWAILELVFFCVVSFYLAPRLNQFESPVEYPIEAKRLVSKILDTVDWLSKQSDLEYDFSSFLTGWFLGTPTSELQRNNVIVFLAWAMHAKEAADLSKTERRDVLGVVKIIEKRLGRTLQNASDVKGKAPDEGIVFFHGLGIGLIYYVKAIWTLCKGKTAIIMESPEIMMNLHLLRGHTPLKEARLAQIVEDIMNRHGLAKATFFGHSFGSIAVAWMARRRPDLVSQVALLDPVCLLLFLPDVASRFLHPDTERLGIVDSMMLDLVTKEMGISHTLRRHFWWYANIMWPENIRCPMVVALSGQDKLVPVQRVRRLLLSHPEFVDASGATDGAKRDRHGVQRTGRTPGQGARGQESGDGLGEGPQAAVSGAQASRAGAESARRQGGDDGSSEEERNGRGTASPKRVEVLYWERHGHGTAMFDPVALTEFDSLCRLQQETFRTVAE